MQKSQGKTEEKKKKQKNFKSQNQQKPKPVLHFSKHCHRLFKLQELKENMAVNDESMLSCPSHFPHNC